MMHPRILALAVALVASSSRSAAAYCRTHTEDPDNTCPAPKPCFDRGVPLAWHRSELSYGLNQRGITGMSEAQVRATLDAATTAWEDVTCDGHSLGVHITQLPGTTSLDQGPKADEPNENVITHYDAATWAELDYSPLAFAETAVWFVPQTGEIVGADIDLNGGWDLFTDCAVERCSRFGDGFKTDLQNVTTHEFGHFLGLSHSPEIGSTMTCDADSTATDKRSLELDDIAAICATYPPGTFSPHHSGCSAAFPERAGHDARGDGLLVLLAVLSCRRLRNLRARREPQTGDLAI